MVEHVLIAGGGIGGLSAALALAQKGFRVSVLEKASRFGEIGAGIQVGPNGFNCLKKLGLVDAVLKSAVRIDALKLMDATTASEIATIPLDENYRRHMGNPYAVVHRADLHQALLEGCDAHDAVTLHTEMSVSRYEQSSGGVIAVLNDGRRVAGDILIAADGLHSPIRAQMVGDGAPRISGHTTYRSVIQTEDMPEDLRWNAATLWAGPKCHIVHYPLKGWKVFNLVVTYHRDYFEAVSGRPVSKAEVAEGFEHIHPKARQIIEHGEDWKLWVLCDREPIEYWVDGRVALLGDAAHPMLQYLAQGACMAMEDAVTLADMLARHPNHDDALGAYQRARVPRTADVQVGSRLMGDFVYHPDGLLAAARNEIMGQRSPAIWNETLSWLHGFSGQSVEQNLALREAI